MGKGTKKEQFYFLFITDSNIFAQTQTLQVKRAKNISVWLILAKTMSIFAGIAA